jgi:hypothetical protein
MQLALQAVWRGAQRRGGVTDLVLVAVEHEVLLAQRLFDVQYRKKAGKKAAARDDSATAAAAPDPGPGSGDT